MAQEKLSNAAQKLLEPLRKAFLDHGYDQLTMVGLAQACGLTRRALYHHFSDKEHAFRFMLEADTRKAIAEAKEAGEICLAEGDDAVTILVKVMDTRYATNRRMLAASPHAVEINDQAFRRARDIMIDAAVVFQQDLCGLLGKMEKAGLFTRRRGIDYPELAQALCDGARGSNQSLPPVEPARLPERYRSIISAILFGMTTW